MNRSAARLVSLALGVGIATALLSGLLLVVSAKVVRAAGVVASPCSGDCDGSGDVTVNEIVTLVNMALGSQTQLSACSQGMPPNITDVSQVDVAVIIQAVNNALSGCPATPTPVAVTPTPSRTPTLAPTRTNTPSNTSPYVGVFTGPAAITTGPQQGLTGQATIVIGADGKAAVAFGATSGFAEGFAAAGSGVANLETGAVTLHELDATLTDFFSGSIQLRAGGTGSGAFTITASQGVSTGTVTITARAPITSDYVGAYLGTLSVTAGPDSGHSQAIEMFIANDGSVGGNTFDDAGDGFTFHGTANFTTRAITLTVDSGNEGLSGVTGSLAGIFGSPTLATANFSLSNGDTGTVSFPKVAP